MSNQQTEAGKMMSSLQGIINRGGVFVSLKQKEYLTKYLGENYGFFDISVAGIEAVEGMTYITITDSVRWADYGTRSYQQYGFVYEMDSIGIVRQWKLHWRGNLKIGTSINSDRTELLFTRAPKVDSSHLTPAPEDKVDMGRFLGSVGDKVTATVRLVREFGSSNYYGVSQFLIMEEVGTGNSVVWSSSKIQDINVGDVFTITGKVKEQKVYRNKNQTSLTRCKINVA